MEESYSEVLARVRAMHGSLAERLAAIRAAWQRYLPGYDGAVERFVARLAEAGAGSAAPGPGEKLPDFVLPDVSGHLVRLEALRAAGPVVVSFERGAWCPLCRSEVSALAQAAPRVKALGGQIVTISPQRAAHGARHLEDAAADFPMLCDIDLGYATGLGLTVPIGEELRAQYEGFAIDLDDYNAGSGALLPIPATFVIAPDGTIVERHIDPDPRRRMEPDTMVQALSRIAAGASAGGAAREEAG